MHVTLTWQEQLFAAQAGIMRRINAISRNLCEPYGTPKVDLWGNDIESSGAEAAVAKALGRYWSAVLQNTQDADGDVSGLEVRSTQRSDGRLIIHDRDKDDAPYILVRGAFPNYEICGWVLGRDAKKDKYRFNGDGRSAYFIPSNELRPIEELSR